MYVCVCVCSNRPRTRRPRGFEARRSPSPSSQGSVATTVPTTPAGWCGRSGSCVHPCVSMCAGCAAHYWTAAPLRLLSLSHMLCCWVTQCANVLLRIMDEHPGAVLLPGASTQCLHHTVPLACVSNLRAGAAEVVCAVACACHHPPRFPRPPCAHCTPLQPRRRQSSLHCRVSGFWTFLRARACVPLAPLSWERAWCPRT
jgi:hypothetical protein